MSKPIKNQGPYNSRIINSFMHLIESRYPHVDVDELLSYAGMELYQVTDQAHWFDQESVDRFYEKLVELTGNKRIAREAGRYAASYQDNNLMRRYFLALLGPGGADASGGKAAQNFTSSTSYQSRRLHRNSVEIIVTVEEGVEEKPYQCENRMGMLEAVAMLFQHKVPRIIHDECQFKGASRCRYIITWDNAPSITFRHILSLYAPAALALNFLWRTLDFSSGRILFPTLSLAGFLGILLVSKEMELKEIKGYMGTQQSAADELIHQIDLNYNNTRIAQEITQEVNKKITHEEIIERVMQVVQRRLDYDRGLILLANEEQTRLVYQGGFGYQEEQTDFLKANAFHLDKDSSRGCFVLCHKEKRPYLVNNVDEIKMDLTPRSLEFARRMGSKSFITVPIISEGESLGIFTVDNLHSQRPLLQTDISLLMSIAAVTAIGLKNARLLLNKEKQFQSLLQVLASSIDARDPLTAGHSEKVTEYVDIICREMALSREYREMIRIAALLHDYGKIGVPDSILKKQGPLTDEEFQTIQTHVVKTREILDKIDFEGILSEIPAIAGAHHERMDGTGYPNGLKGEEIPLGARILSVADFFEAITSQRHYRNPMSIQNAVRVLDKEKGHHLDGRIVDVFIGYLGKLYGTSFTNAHEAGEDPYRSGKNHLIPFATPSARGNGGEPQRNEAMAARSSRISAGRTYLASSPAPRPEKK